MPVIVPGLGYAGLGQMTRATQTLFSQAMRGRSGSSTGARRRRKAPKKRAAKRAASRTGRMRRAAKPKRLVRGSAAAKRYMAKIRKMRK